MSTTRSGGGGAPPCAPPRATPGARAPTPGATRSRSTMSRNSGRAVLLVHLVDDDVRELRERRVARELAQQQPRRHEHELRVGARAARVLAADRVADRLAERLAALARDALGDRHGRDPARLRDDDLARRPHRPAAERGRAARARAAAAAAARAAARAAAPGRLDAEAAVVADDAGGRGAASSPSSSRNCGTCVLLPQPVSPDTSTTACARTSSTTLRRWRHAGSRCARRGARLPWRWRACSRTRAAARPTSPRAPRRRGRRRAPVVRRAAARRRACRRRACRRASSGRCASPPAASARGRELARRRRVARRVRRERAPRAVSGSGGGGARSPSASSASAAAARFSCCAECFETVR